MPTHYDLKVNRSTLITQGSQLTELSPIDPGDPTLGMITTVARDSNTGVGDCAFNAARVFLRQTTINTIHNRVNDNNPNRHVTVHFSVSSSGVLSGFEHTYST